MIEIAQINGPLAAQYLATPGSFTWWYLDLRNAAGDGVIVVWSLGLPFLPGSRTLTPAAQRPSLLVSYVRAGTPELHLLQEFGAGDANLDLVSGNGSLGNCHFMTKYKERELSISARLQLQVPQSSTVLNAEIEATGPSVPLKHTTDRAGHIWSPQTLFANGHARITHGNEVRSVSGSAYFDKNVSRHPLHDQNISSWRWGRVRFDQETLVYYDIEAADGTKEAMVVSQTEDGAFLHRTLAMEFSQNRSSIFGARAPRRLEITGHDVSYLIEVSDLIEDGPFYQRYMVTGERRSLGRRETRETDRGYGIAEFVLPTRIDMSWQRPFVRMRTERVGKANSIFLPLFTGFTHDRLERLARSLMRRMTA